MRNQKRIVIAGGSGFIGRSLAQELLRRGYEIVVLTRSPRARFDGIREFEWDGEHLGEWLKLLEGAEAIVNLTGKNINCPHTPENVRELTASRVNSIRTIADAFQHIKTYPRVWVQAGAIGFYGDQKEKICDEDSPPGNDTLVEICKQWEVAFNSADAPKTRKILLRIGLVLGREGGALPVLEKLTKWFLGGTVGSGKQFISWVDRADLIKMFVEAIECDDWAGTFNAVAPNPVTNKEFMCELRRALHRPWSPPAPVWAVKFGSRLMKSEPSLALVGCCVAPRRLLENHFQFHFPELRGALKKLYE
jgi:uncharacterized protein (TIGR01777 family)